MRFPMYKYADILWMDDFDWNDDEALNPESYTPEDCEFATLEDVSLYIPEKYHFRVHPYKYVLQVLDELKNNFSQYSCAVLDINMKQGFYFNDLDDEEEYKKIESLLIEENVIIRDEHAWDNDGYSQFKDNAGYYIYLYLLHRGMPAERIAILTGNKGKNNLTEKWEENFKQAGLNPPKSFDKDTEIEQFKIWLDKMLTKQQRIRSCMVIMSRYILDSIKEKDNIKDGFAYKTKENESDAIITRKLALQFMQDISLRIPSNNDDACAFFYPLIWQISQPWEASEVLPFYNYISVNNNELYLQNVKYAFWTTMRTSRNWLAHNIVKEFNNLNTIAFIFGISLRGMFDLREELETKYFDEYIRWENELLSLICDKSHHTLNNLEDTLKNLNSLVIKSCSEYHKRIRDKLKEYEKLRINEYTRNICYLINDIGQKSNHIRCDEYDLLRDFLHGINYLYIKEDANNSKSKITECLIRYTMEVDIRCRTAYKNFLQCKITNSNSDQKNISINSNREWDYIESIYKLIEDSIKSKTSHNKKNTFL